MMADSRRRSRSATDDEDDRPDRTVIPRTSPSTDGSDSDEEPSEDTGESQPVLSSSPPTVPTPVASPSANPPPVPSSSAFTAAFSVFTSANPLRWDWMPRLLKEWRQAERMPVLPPVSGPSTPIPFLTQEPVHETIPVLITRLLTHDHHFKMHQKAIEERINMPDEEIRQLKEDILAARTDISVIQEAVNDLQDDVNTYGGQIEGLVHRTRRAEERAETAESLSARFEARLNDMELELAAVTADRDQMRTVIAHSTRLVDRLDALCERLR